MKENAMSAAEYFALVDQKISFSPEDAEQVGLYDNIAIDHEEAGSNSESEYESGRVQNQAAKPSTNLNANADSEDLPVVVFQPSNSSSGAPIPRMRGIIERTEGEIKERQDRRRLECGILNVMNTNFIPSDFRLTFKNSGCEESDNGSNNSRRFRRPEMDIRLRESSSLSSLSPPFAIFFLVPQKNHLRRALLFDSATRLLKVQILGLWAHRIVFIANLRQQSPREIVQQWIDYRDSVIGEWRYREELKKQSCYNITDAHSEMISIGNSANQGTDAAVEGARAQRDVLNNNSSTKFNAINPNTRRTALAKPKGQASRPKSKSVSAKPKSRAKGKAKAKPDPKKMTIARTMLRNVSAEDIRSMWRLLQDEENFEP